MLTSYYRIGFRAGLIALLQTLAAPVVCVLTLLLSTKIQRVPFTDPYVALAVAAAVCIGRRANAQRLRVARAARDVDDVRQAGDAPRRRAVVRVAVPQPAVARAAPRVCV